MADTYGLDFGWDGWDDPQSSYDFGGRWNDMPVSSGTPFVLDSGYSSSFLDPYMRQFQTSDAYTLGAPQETALPVAYQASPASMTSYFNSPEAIAANSQPSAEPSFWSKLGGYADDLESGAKKYSTLAGLGMGGLQMWAAMKEREKLEQRRRQQEEEQRAALAKMQAKYARNEAPINTQTAAYSQARAPLNGFKDMRKEGSSRWFAPSTGNLAAAFNQEATRAADGGLIEGYAKGGLSAMQQPMGPTGGQDDKIPALLSDGEYVMDAESVSALGDGNTAAGAKKLDEMRVKIRKHKRKGPLSSIPKKAKAPMKYLEGGKA